MKRNWIRRVLLFGALAATVVSLISTPLPAHAHDCVYIGPPTDLGDATCPASDPTTHMCTIEPTMFGTLWVCTTITL